MAGPPSPSPSPSPLFPPLIAHSSGTPGFSSALPSITDDDGAYSSFFSTSLRKGPNQPIPDVTSVLVKMFKTALQQHPTFVWVLFGCGGGGGMPPPTKPSLDREGGIVGRKSLQIARPVQRAIYQDEYMVSCKADTEPPSDAGADFAEREFWVLTLVTTIPTGILRRGRCFARWCRQDQSFGSAHGRQGRCHPPRQG
jgi:hypothetical protein